MDDRDIAPNDFCDKIRELCADILGATVILSQSEPLPPEKEFEAMMDREVQKIIGPVRGNRGQTYQIRLGDLKRITIAFLQDGLKRMDA